MIPPIFLYVILSTLPIGLLGQAEVKKEFISTEENLPLLKSTMNCGNDTILYALSKATAIEYQAVSAPELYVKIAQRFMAPQEITVHGACFYAYTGIFGSAPAAITLEMYSVDSLGLPDTIIASQSTTIPLGSGVPVSSARNCVTWSSPVTYSEDFYLSIDGSGTTEPLGIGRNSFSNTDGQGEALSAVYYDDLSGASYVKWYNQTTDPAFATTPWDYDYLLEPIVSYELHTAMSVSADTACFGSVICVESDSLSPILYNSMYNTDPSVIKETNWGNGNTSNGDSTCNSYSTAGNYLINHSVTMEGWKINCVVNEIDSVEIEGPIADFSYNIMNDTVLFTNTSIGASTISWTFDTLSSSMAFDTTIIFPTNGTYSIQQIATSGYGCVDSTTQIVNITVGTNETVTIIPPKLYPNPNSGVFRIEFKSKQEQIELTIATIKGKLVRSIKYHNVNLIDVDFRESPGLYILTLNGTNITTSFPVVIQ
ncbi:MAG: T9SS type A sorting domain-containing protein [Crocinitomicaceae bacterium]|jgi:hypothetical protein|nr:T9SS type A sorting domain-containing protein [Crocinitomicaceae bacterium]MBT5403173.1 T9SS type A sorting domain-containing protein [Crocinitomicaceae bacterium]MBT6513904.1 T9SS type A sorting domain-containing protein [Crocinitomicaceae bacterium]